MSYEYVACQQKKQGVLVLSEFAGAAQSLNGSIVVNPWDSQAVADAMFEAVTMPAEARALNHEKLFKVSLPSSRVFWADHSGGVPVVLSLLGNISLHWIQR